MLRRSLLQASSWRSRPVCLLCAAQAQSQLSQFRSFGTTDPLLKRTRKSTSKATKPEDDGDTGLISYHMSVSKEELDQKAPDKEVRVKKAKAAPKPKKTKEIDEAVPTAKKSREPKAADDRTPMSLREALLGKEGTTDASKKRRMQREEQLDIQTMEVEDLTFEPVEVDIPPVPMLSYGLDRVLFNPGVYRLQDPRSRIYNFDPYLEKIMPVHEFDFDALSEYKTSSKDEALLALTKRLGTKFTGSTSSMSSVLQHFHYLLSNFRDLNHVMMSRGFPEPSKNFSKITLGPSAVFLRYKDGIYAIDADKTYDSPNIMSWLGHSLEKLLTTERTEFELFRRSSPEPAPAEDNSSRCYHYSKQGNILMRSQLDAHDPRLPGTGVFDLKTRAVVSIRMNHKEYEQGSGYQLRYAQGEWESFEREFYDMTRATLLKYSLQVRMGRMDGIFLAYHNIERIFGFQYLSLGEMDRVLHGQDNTSLGDQEFKLSIGLMDELLSRATAKFPETSVRLHFETRQAKTPFMYVFAEPVTEEQADEIQGAGEAAQKEFARTVVGLGKDDPEVQAAWHNIQDAVDEQIDKDEEGKSAEALEEQDSETEDAAKTTEESKEQEQKLAAETTQEEHTDEVESQKSSTEAAEDAEGAETAESIPEGPLMGWTLSIRSKINGGYVDRPRKFSEEDEWKVEYHIQEIPEQSCWKLYNALKERRHALVGVQDKEVDKGLSHYRSLIQRFSNKGREWRQAQDKLDEEMGVQIYKPLGPGSDAVAPAAIDATDKTT